MQGVGDLNAQFQDAVDRQRSARDQVLQGVSFHQFHDDERLPVELRDLVDGANIRMVQRGGGASFAEETLEGLRVLGGIRRQEFESDAAIQHRIAGGINNAHATTA